MAGIDVAEELPQTQFQAGELVAHPVHGLCRIQKIERTNIGEGRRLYYTFLIGTAHVKAKVFVPVAEAARWGVRYPVTRPEAQSILRILENPEGGSGLTQRDCLEQISACFQAGDLFRLAELVQTAWSHGVSFFGEDFHEGSVSGPHRDQILLTRAIQRVVSELAFALGESPSAVKKQICKKLKKKVLDR